jgi:hypothetical protein
MQIQWFKVNNLGIKLPPYKIFVSLVFKFTAVKETLNWGVTNRFCDGMWSLVKA